MGIYLNPGNESFEEALRSKIYVDKTGLIKYTNEVLGTEQKYICVSRPRRFGKSMAARMLAAYYSSDCDSKEMFHELEIGKDISFTNHLNKYNVLFLNMQDFLSRAKEPQNMVECLQEYVIRDLKRVYGNQLNNGENHLVPILEEIYSTTRKGFVFIIDEWDCPFRLNMHDTELQTAYLDFLRAMLKDKTYVKLAYMTGILPIKKYGTHSALNMFDEYSMTNPKRLTRFVGFTEQEVKELCQQYHMDFDETKRWYDGYRFRKMKHIYSPKSVVDAMLNEEFDSYWTQTETYEALKLYIDMNYDGLKDAVILMLGGGFYPINLRTFQNDMMTFKGKDDVLTLLIHLGYLAYDEEKKSVFIPNKEVEEEFADAIEGAGWQEVMQAIIATQRLLEATWREVFGLL